MHHRWCTRHLVENLLRKDRSKANFPLFEEVYRPLEVLFFEDKLKELKDATNAEGKNWIAGLLREPQKWTRAYDEGGWRFEFQTSNMAKSFNSVLKGIRGMPVNAIVTFTFYRLMAWFNDRHAQTKATQTRGQRWAPKPTSHLNNAKERGHRHEVQCCDEELGKYEVTTMGGITSDSEVRPSRTHVVLLDAFSCGCGKPRQYHFPCSHYVVAARHHNLAFESRIPSEFSVESLVRT
jgi:hypothetical protein